ncbi:hypothetical protein BDQ94DRAFT_148134 [Aspergillus welwitschiae]|uniref:Uncharacterized protein n=1 Tax=Aspergillus welwitschiae TaxID=1341132 RepID=A0A3F3PVX2_9EURO|nr:hypothetical protein BDQ94DRAFT_148134 [Aspergillus welwitschiae]RDH30892.1 hypothetical protein BDQ94DRAFT_148134 [Aspergillus welwitschiae]
MGRNLLRNHSTPLPGVKPPQREQNLHVSSICDQEPPGRPRSLHGEKHRSGRVLARKAKAERPVDGRGMKQMAVNM